MVLIKDNFVPHEKCKCFFSDVPMKCISEKKKKKIRMKDTNEKTMERKDRIKKDSKSNRIKCLRSLIDILN